MRSLFAILLFLPALPTSAAGQVRLESPEFNAPEESLPASLQSPGQVFREPAFLDPPVVPDDLPAGRPPRRDYHDPPPWITIAKGSNTVTWLPGSGDSFGIFETDSVLTLALPRLPGVTVSPMWGTAFLSGPSRTDMPPRLYSGRMEFKWFRQHARPFATELAVMPGIYSDFERGGSDAVRVVAHAVGILGLSLQTQIVFGGIYLDREDVPALPIVGIIHSPREDLRAELIFPRPRLLARVFQWHEREGWAYLLGEFGGGSWAIKRVDGTRDVATYRDLRLMAGLETRFASGRNVFLEAGWAFGRNLEYTSTVGDFSPRDAAVLRLGVTH